MAIDRERSLSKGQAAVEFAIGIFVILLIVSGLVGFSQVIRASMDLQGELRAEAGTAAMSSGIGQTPSYVRNWDVGADNIPFTPDDKPEGGGNGVGGTMSAMTAVSVENEENWVYPSAHSALPFSLIGFREIPAMPISFSKAEDETDIEVDPFAAEYLFGSTEAFVSEKVLMPVMGGLL